MFDMKKLALAGALAMIAAAAQPGHLADRHAARSVDCAACHAVKTPAEGAEVDTQKCLACHVSLNAVSEKIHARDNAQSPDPHVNHSLGLNCVECHKGHEQSVNMCSRCHLFEYKVP